MLPDVDTLLSGNLLLNALRVPDLALIKPHVELKDYARGNALFEAGEDVSFISFPLGQCVAALVTGLPAEGPLSAMAGPREAAAA